MLKMQSSYDNIMLDAREIYLLFRYTWDFLLTTNSLTLSFLMLM